MVIELKKVINPKPKIKIKSISNSITSVDADNAVGFIGANLGIDYAIKNARKLNRFCFSKK